LSLYRHLHRDRKVLQEFFSAFYLLLENIKITIYTATILFNTMRAENGKIRCILLHSSFTFLLLLKFINFTQLSLFGNLKRIKRNYHVKSHHVFRNLDRSFDRQV